MAQKSIFNYRVNQQDLDCTQRASSASIIRDILSAAGEDARNHKFGVENLNLSNRTWVLSRLSIEIDGLPHCDEPFTITTWIEGYNKLFSSRNFNLKGESFSAAATTQWCIIDLSTRRPIDLTQLPTHYQDAVIAEVSTITPSRKIAPIIEPTKSMSRQIMYSDIDFNQHVNTMRYIDMMQNLLPLNIINQRRFRFDLQFIHECYIDQTLKVEMEQRDNTYLFAITREDGSVAVRGALTTLSSQPH